MYNSPPCPQLLQSSEPIVFCIDPISLYFHAIPICMQLCKSWKVCKNEGWVSIKKCNLYCYNFKKPSARPHLKLQFPLILVSCELQLITDPGILTNCFSILVPPTYLFICPKVLPYYWNFWCFNVNPSCDLCYCFSLILDFCCLFLAHIYMQPSRIQLV
jgi:hypothetical protein